jgi:hypothetical protein
MANTNILIKRSSSVGVPGGLLAGELAYSYASNTIFIGSPTGNGVVNVGGQFYTSQIDNATAAATGSTLVRRDASGNASFNFITANIIGEIIGNANSATQLQTARNFSIDGGDITAGAISFNGTGDVVLNASLDAVPSLGAGSYGSQTEIPIIQVAANGRVMNVTTQAISTTLSTSADSGTGSVNLLNDTLNFVGAQGITTSDSGNTVTFNVDDTVIRANAFTGGTQTINTNLTIGANNDLTVTGNLIVTGNVITQNVQQLAVQDPLIVLGVGNYFSDTKDIGFAAHYNDGSNAHTGLVRDADGDKEYYFFEGYTGEIDAGNNININDPSFRKSNVHANSFKGNTIGDTVQANTIYVANRIFGDTSNNTLELIPSDNYGSGVNDQYIVLDPTAPNHIHIRAGGNIDESTAELYLGGDQTNVNVSDTTKEVYIRANNLHVWTFGEDGVLNLPGAITSNSTGIVTVDDNLTVTGNLVVAGDIVIDDLQVDTITANTLTLTNALTVPNGGTGKTSFTSGQIVIGSGVNGLTQIANSSVAIGQTFGSASSVAAFETDVYGRVVAVSNTSIAIATSQITSGTLGYDRGGTGSTSYTTGGLLIAGASGFGSLANTTYTQTGTLTSNNTITSITVDAYGRFTAATVGAISGLTVEQGGTGLSTITQNGITYGNGTGNLGVTAAAGGADQTWSNQILTVTNAGVPVWTTALDGGVF